MHAQFDGPSFAVLYFGLQQGFEVMTMRVIVSRSFFGERGELRTDSSESKRLRVLRDACGLEAPSLEAHARTACMLTEKSWWYLMMVGRGPW